MSKIMGKYITVKYLAESEFATVPYQASEDAAGYDLFPTETKTLLPNSANTISLDFNWFLCKTISTFWSFERKFSYC